MSYVIYDNRTKQIVINPRTRTKHYKTLASATRGRNHMLNKGDLVDNQQPDHADLIQSWYNIAELSYFLVHVKGVMS